MKTIGLYSPYIPKHAGGGERYLLSIAEAAATVGKAVLLVPEDKVEDTKKQLPKYEQQFGLNLQAVSVEASTLGIARNPIKTFGQTKRFDVLFAMTDGSIFASGAKQSFLIMQVPWTRNISLLERAKLQTWKRVLVYSDFVKAVLRKHWSIGNIDILAPYVDINEFMPAKKEKIILTVGRFFAHKESNSKRQDVLIEAFKHLVDTYAAKGWQLYIAGNIDPNPDSYQFVEQLREQARGYPVAFFPNGSFDQIVSLNAHASVYWHAAGYEVDEQLHPENTEHFGITTLEAMSSGAIPFVVPKGGQREVLPYEELWWETPSELAQKTSILLRQEKEVIEMKRSEMRSAATLYSKEAFTKKVIACMQ